MLLRMTGQSLTCSSVLPTTTTNAPASTVSSSAVTSGTTGIADFSCTNNTLMYSAPPAGLAYKEFCNTVFYYNTPSVFSIPDGSIRAVFASNKYSFQDCVNSCDDWNADNPGAEEECRAVSYYANLTNVFANQSNK